MNRLSVLALAMCLVAASVPVFAQEMDPKSYAASPVGATFVVGSVARSTGSVLLDPTPAQTSARSPWAGSGCRSGRSAARYCAAMRCVRSNAASSVSAFSGLLT